MTPAMTINALITLGIFVTLGVAMAKRPGALTYSLGIALAVSLALLAILSKPDQLSALLAVDAGVVAFAAHLARTGPPPVAEPARIVAVVGTLKIVFAISGVLLDMGHNVRAAGRNGAFVVQIIVAGGLADGLIAWLGHRGRSAADRARRVLHRLEGE